MQSLPVALGVSDGHPPSSSSSPDPLLGAATPLGGKMDAGSYEKSHPRSISVFISPPNQMDCGQRCTEMQSNEGELRPLSKVETVVRPGFVSVSVDSPAALRSHRSCTSASAAAAVRAQQWPRALPKSGLSLSQDQTCAMNCVCQTAQENVLPCGTA